MCPFSRILYCHCAYTDIVPKAVKEEILASLGESDVEFSMVPDLCELSARRDPFLKELATGGHVKIVACFPRAVRCLFSAADATLPENGVEILNMRTENAEKILQALLGEATTGRDSQ